MIPEIQGDGERVNSMLLATSSCVEQVLAERAGDDCRRGGSDARARPVAAGVGWRRSPRSRSLPAQVDAVWTAITHLDHLLLGSIASPAW
jgi:hypothetical protein